jgi:PAS domain S-box-containing protein
MSLSQSSQNASSCYEEVEELEEYHRKFLSMFQNITLPTIMLNDSWRLKFANDHFLERTGYQREEVLYCDWVDTFIASDKKEKARNTYELIESGIVEMAPFIEQEIVAKDGSPLIIKWNNTVIKNKAGAFMGVSCIGEEISWKKTSLLTVRNCITQADSDNPPGNFLKDYDLGFPEELPAAGSINGTTLDDLILVKVLNNLGGDRGYVQLAVHKETKSKVAVKALRKDLMNAEEIERARREISIMAQLTKLNNPYIIKLIGWEENSTHFNLIIEYVSGGELTSLILKKNGLTEFETQLMFKQLLSAIKCCHQNQIIHRDIKLQNILLDTQNNIKLIDFGLSNFMEDDALRGTFCGTPAYASPEILTGVQYRGPEVDIWSLGIVLYSMLTAHFPFTTVADIIKGNFKPPEKISPECLDLLVQMLQVKKEQRATLDQVMRHPWLSKAEEELTSQSNKRSRPSFDHSQQPQLQGRVGEGDCAPIKKQRRLSSGTLSGIRRFHSSSAPSVHITLD